MKSDFGSQVNSINQACKQNKDKVIDYLIDNILNVAIDLPDNIKKTKAE